MNEFQYAAAEQDDLWRHLTDQGHKDGTLDKDMTVKSIMDTWTLQMGFPVVTIKRNYDKMTANLTQEKYRFMTLTTNKEYSWWVPLTFGSPEQTSSTDLKTLWMAEGEKSKELSGLPSKEMPVIFNIQQKSYYRYICCISYGESMVIMYDFLYIFLYML